MSCEDIEIQNMKCTILLVHGNIAFIQFSRWMFICFSWFHL